MNTKNSSTVQPNSDSLNLVSRILSFLLKDNRGRATSGVASIFLIAVIAFPSVPQTILKKTNFIFGLIKDSKQCTESSKDPLDINGLWNYETNMTTSELPNGVNGIVSYIGVNSIQISSDCNSYTMDGKRTHKVVKNKGNVSTLPDEQPIKMSRVVADVNARTFSFHFEVSQNKGKGFAELHLDPDSNTMEGTIYYLLPEKNSIRQWEEVKIKFFKTNRS